MTRSTWKHLAVILAVATVCRAAYAVLVWTPWFISPSETMSKMYVRSAYALSAGLGYAQTIPDSPADEDLKNLVREGETGKWIRWSSGPRVRPDGLYPEMLHPPGWSLIAASLHRGLGVPVTRAMHCVTAVVDVAACAMLYWLVLLALDSVRVARVAAWLYAVFPPLCYASATLRPIGFMSFFMILATIWIVLAVRSRKAAARWGCYVLCGATIGLAGYFRPDFLLLGPFFFLGLWFIRRRFFSSLAAAAGILAVSLIVLFPWARRNHKLCGRWMFTSCGAGCTLISGLGAYDNPWGFGPSDHDRARETAEQGLRTPFCPEADTYFRGRFFDAVREHPWAYAWIVARRSFQAVAPPYAWGLKLPARTKSFSSLRREGKLVENLGYLAKAFWPRISMAVVSLAALICALIVLIRRWRGPVWLVMLVPLYAALSHMFSHMAPYYLLPGAFAQLTALAYVLGRGWRDDPKRPATR